MGIEIILKKRKPKPSIVYDTYWRFAFERQNIFFRRLNSFNREKWTTDQVLSNYKFTNVYRVTDRVSQFLISEVIPKGSQEPDELFFRIILFKLFNKIETWQRIGKIVGEISWETFDIDRYSSILDDLRSNGDTIYSNAYIMASGKEYFGFPRKHQNHLMLLQRMQGENVPYKIGNCKTMKEVYHLLLTYPCIGPFLSYQFATDINYSNLTAFSEMEFVKAGPGAKDGISKCFLELGDYSEEDVIKMVCDSQEKEFERLGLLFKDLGGRRMQLIDCQNVFCEVDKYSRLVHPTISSKSNRTRIKQKYTHPGSPILKYYFPRNWFINSDLLIYGETKQYFH